MLARRTMVVLGLAAAATGAAARNDRLLIPIAEAMRTRAVRQVVSPDVPLQFGTRSAQGVDGTAGGTTVHAVVSPARSDQQGRPHPRPDDVVCIEAFGKALQELQKGARAAGASAVVGIVSNHGGTVLDSSDSFECHIGMTRGVVDLKGQFARGALPFQPVIAPPVATVPQPAHIASGFAAIDDVDAVPLINDKGREFYREWLTHSTPRAFAISPTGQWVGTWGVNVRDPSMPQDPAERALLGCARKAGTPCRLYAVNGAVVWTQDGAR